MTNVEQQKNVKLKITFKEKKTQKPIVGLKFYFKVSSEYLQVKNDQSQRMTSDANGNYEIRDIPADSKMELWIQKIDGKEKSIGVINMRGVDKSVTVFSDTELYEVTTKEHGTVSGELITELRPKDALLQVFDKTKEAASSAVAGLTRIIKEGQDKKEKPVVAVVSPALEKSGTQWYERFRNPTSLDDLEPQFQEKFRAFYNAMLEAGLSVRLDVVYRSPQRAYLMYYSKRISMSWRGHKQISPDKVPQFEVREGYSQEPVNIDWAHRDKDGKPDLAEAKKAAKALYDLFKIGTNPVAPPYTSRHSAIPVLGVDMKITGYGSKGVSIKKKDGKFVVVKNISELSAVGATYGVFWFGWDDAPHWSSDGH
jgi:hypothetical protein